MSRLYLIALDRCRRRMLRMALRKMHGRVSHAADLLGLDRAGMYAMLKGHGIKPNDFR